VIEAIPLGRIHSEGYAFQIEMAWRAWLAGFAVIEIPIVFADRTQGQSKMSRGIVFEAAWSVLRWAMTRKRPPSRPHPSSVRA
jgi:hypothetical protein